MKAILQEKTRLQKGLNVLEMMEKFEERIDTMKKGLSDNRLPNHPRYIKDYEFAQISLVRLENYYKKLFK